MIHSITQPNEELQSYLINDSVLIHISDTINEGIIDADYDETLLTETEVEELVNELMKLILERAKDEK